MATKQIVPALGLDSFTCPHVNCGAIAHQTWFRLYVLRFDKDDRPWVPTDQHLENLRSGEQNREVLTFFVKMSEREIFFETHNESNYLNTVCINLYVSKCFSCGNISVWRADELIYPVNHVSVEPNEGMPPDVRADFHEEN
jgi:hypothetical protein